MFLKQVFKLRMKRILLQLLKKLDGTLADNLSSVSHVTMAHQVDQPDIPEAAQSYEVSSQLPTLIFNKDSSVINYAMIKRAVCDFFAISDLKEHYQLYVNFLVEKSTFINTKEQLSYLFQNLTFQNFPSLSETILSKDKAILCERILEGHKNSLSYIEQDKLNPQGIWWPDPTYIKNPRSLFEELPWAKPTPFINKDTSISSAGSCFAVEIAHRLQKNGFNYVVKENRLKQELVNAPANWGIIFNASAMRQLVEKAFGLKKLPKILWSAKSGNQIRYYDPFREDVIFNSVSEYENDYERHLQACREVFLSSDVFVMTLGMCEVWSLRADGAVFSRSPWNISPELVQRNVLSVDDNVRELQKFIDVLRVFNPKIKIIISVSPVPLHATFQAESSHVVTANCLSKATLRCAVEKFSKQNEGVYYFPSYETVIHCTKQPWEADQRHVSKQAVDNVMSLFTKLYLDEDIQLNSELIDVA